MHTTHTRIDPTLLQQELAAAGIPVRGVGYSPTPEQGGGEVYTYDEAGSPIDLPPEAQPVVDAHDPPPPITSVAAGIDVDRTLRTTDATQTEAYRLTLAPKHGYRADCRLMAIDAGNGALRSWEARFVFKRLAGAAIRVGYTFVSDISDTGAQAWAVTANPVGDDMVILVTGAAGRTIDWLLVGQIGTYAPDGLA